MCRRRVVKYVQDGLNHLRVSVFSLTSWAKQKTLSSGVARLQIICFMQVIRWPDKNAQPACCYISIEQIRRGCAGGDLKMMRMFGHSAGLLHKIAYPESKSDGQ